MSFQPLTSSILALPDVTVSLTTTSRRIAQVHQVIESLHNQTVPPARIVLWLSYDSHLLDDGVNEKGVPSSLMRLVGGRFEIRWTRNIGPYRKLLPALQCFGGVVVTADDDTRYPVNWLERLLTMHAQTPQSICCYRAHRMLVNDAGEFVSYWRWPQYDSTLAGSDCFPTGKDGVLYPPNALHDDVFDAGRFLSLAPTSDDIWFKVMALRRGTPARGVLGHEAFPVVAVSTHLDGLYARYNLIGNDETLSDVCAAYEVSPRIVAHDHSLDVCTMPNGSDETR